MKLHFIRAIVGLLLIYIPCKVNSQSVFLQQGSKENILLDRLEIKAQKDTVLNFSFIKPFNRKWWTRRLEAIQADSIHVDGLTNIDKYNIERALLNNMEWVTVNKENMQSKKSLWNTFYKTPANMIEVDQPDFFLSVNPILQLQAGKETDNGEMIFLNSKGLVARGLISKRLGFYTYITDNQERGPGYFQQRVDSFKSVPGAGWYKKFKTTGVDYLDARGGLTFNVVKYLDLQFGYDKMFIGNGYRSMFMSEFSNNYLYLNFNLKVWRLNYSSRTMELTSQFKRQDTDELLPKKYMTMHHISFNAPKWLTLGLFDAIVYGRVNNFEFSYLNPFIFLRAMESNRGSEDNAFVGFDFKANVAKRWQFYGQLMLDEFYLKEIKAGDGWWANKYSIQLGTKYIDAFGIKNLDLQVEANAIRPFTYAHNDTVANYTNYNQPMAHPLQSNLREFIGIARYQPAPKWYVQGKLIVWQQGSDTAGKNYGNVILKSTDTRPSDYGFEYGVAVKQKGLNSSLWLGYEWKENFFIEGNIYYRKLATHSSTTASIGIRWNMHRREYDY
jgi:hypothetical protein